MKEKYYTSERSIQILISLLKAHNIKKCVLSPGTTNITLVGSLQQDPWFECYSSVDERSAAYIACGLAAESGEPVMLSCTGATASRNYLPGLTEAYYRKLPVLAVTSTQDISRIGHHIAQVIDRRVMQNDVALLSEYIPVTDNDTKEWSNTVKINRALLELRHRGGGPVHLNVETTYSRDFSVKELPQARVIRRVMPQDAFPEIPQGRVAVMIGSHQKFTDAETQALDTFCATHDAVVFGDHTSGYKGKYRVPVSILASQERDYCSLTDMDLLIHIGEVSGQYYVGHSLSETKTKFGTYDYNEHGTHVAGIVAADANNGKVMAGVSHNAKLLPIKISSYSLENGQIKEDLNIETVAGGINYLINLIDQGKISADDVAAINLSLGLYTSTTAEKLGKTWQETHDDLMSSNMHQAIQKAVNEYDIPVIVAGGNGDGANPRTDETFPSDYDESISVTGTTKSTLADQQQYNFDIQWSDYNEAKDISAPGFGIWSLAPSTAKSSSKTLQYGSTKNTMVQRMSGTSMASPIVAAACAIMRTEVPNATVAEIKQAMQETATKVDEYQGDPYYADRHKNGKSGSPGIINIPAAVEWLKENVAPEEPEPEPAKPNMAAAIMTVDEMSVAPGDTIKVTSTYTLDSSAAADITDIKNTLKLDSGSPTGIAFQTGTLSVKVGGSAVSGVKMTSDGTITGIGNVAAGQSISVTYDVKIGDASSPSALDGKKLTISSSVTADGLTGTTTASTSAISIKAPVVETPSLSMSVSSSSSSVEQGADVPVTVTLRNANSKASVGSIKFTDNVTGGATVKQSSVKVSIGGTDVTSACTVSASGSSLSITINGMDVGDTELTITYTLDTSAASGKVTNKPQFTVTGSTVSAGGQSSISVTVNEPEPEPEPGGNENENENENEGGQQGGGNQNQNDNENENENENQNQGGGTTNPGGGSGNDNKNESSKPSGGNQNQNDNKNQGGNQDSGSTTKPSGGSNTSNDNGNRNVNAQTPTSTDNRTSGDNGSGNDNSTSANGGGSVTDGNSNGGTTTLTSDVNGGSSNGGTLTDDGVSNDATGTSGDGSYDAGSGTPVDTDGIVQTGAAPLIGAGIAGIGATIVAVILSLRDRFKGHK